MSAFLLRYGVTNPTSYSTAFPATEDPISESGSWRTSVNFYKAPRSTPGKCFANAPTDSFDDAIGQLISPQLGNNHSVRTTVFRQGGYTTGVTHEIGHYLRVLIDNSNPSNTLIRGYEMLFPFDSTSFQMVAWLAVNHSFPDNFTILNPTAVNGGLANVQNGDVLESRIVGNLITVYQNGTQIYTLTDSTWTNGGGPGIGFYANTGATPASFCISDYQAMTL